MPSAMTCFAAHADDIHLACRSSHLAYGVILQEQLLRPRGQVGREAS